MRVLLDEQLPRQLRHVLPGHYVRTVRQQRWTGMRNGELLRTAAADGFDVLLTADQSIQFQQNIVGLPIGIVVLAARSTRLQDLLPFLPLVLVALPQVQAGEIRQVGP